MAKKKKILVGGTVIVMAFAVVTAGVLVFQAYSDPSTQPRSDQPASSPSAQPEPAAAGRGVDEVGHQTDAGHTAKQTRNEAESHQLPSMDRVRMIARSRNLQLRLTPEQQQRVAEINVEFSRRVQKAVAKNVARKTPLTRVNQSTGNEQERPVTDSQGEPSRQNSETLAALDSQYRDAVEAVLSEAQMKLLDPALSPEEHREVSGGAGVGPRAASPHQ